MVLWTSVDDASESWPTKRLPVLAAWMLKKKTVKKQRQKAKIIQEFLKGKKVYTKTLSRMLPWNNIILLMDFKRNRPGKSVFKRKKKYNYIKIGVAHTEGVQNIEFFSLKNRKISLFLPIPKVLATSKSCCMYPVLFSVLPRDQWALLSAEKTEPRNLRLHVPIFKAASSTTTDAVWWLAVSSSWPITETTTNGLLSSFIFCSCW